MKQFTNCLIIVLLMFASSAKADNLKVNTVSATPGTTVEIPVELVNTKVYSMFEMNIVLPKGFELTGVTKSERLKNVTLYDISKQNDGSYQIATQSLEEVITGYSGTLFTLSVKVPTTAQGSYTGSINNILFTDMNITPAYLPDVSFTIMVSTPSAITITAKSCSREYGEANPTFSYDVSGGTITGTPKLTCTATKASDVGSYTITVEKGTVQGDVKLVNGTLTVTKAPLTVKANDCERYVGEDNPTFTLSYSGWKNGQGESVLTSKPTATCSATKSSPAGTYPIKVSGGSAKNYSFKYVEGTLTVKEKSSGTPNINLLSVTCDNSNLNSLTQDDKLVFHAKWKNNGETAIISTAIIICDQNMTKIIDASEIDEREFRSGTTITVDYEYALNELNPGNYKATVMYLDDWEYDSWIYYDEFLKDIVVNDNSVAQDVTITAKSCSREYGDANPSFEYTVTGGTITGTPKLTCTATKTSDVGSYTITVEKGTVQGDVKLVNGTLTVTKAPLTVKANDCERFVGEANPSFTLNYSGWKNGQGESVLTSKPTATCTATKSSPAGTYPIKVSGGSAKNYSFKYVEGTLTVKEESSNAPDMKLISWACDNNDLSNLTQDDQLVFHVTWKNNGKTAYLDTQLGLQKIGEDVLLFIRSSQDYREYPKDKEITVTYELSLSGVAEGQYKVHALWYQNWGEIKDWGWYHYIYRSYGEITVNAPSASRTITTSAAGYATFYDSQSNYTLPSGLTAKVVTSVSNGKLTYQTLAGSMVPKGTAVILESSTKQAATYTLTPTTDSGSYTGTNLLRGSDEATTTMGDGYHYKLTYGPSTDSSLKDVFGWYWGSSNGGSFQIDGHKAWLVLPKSAGTRSFSVDGVANGISDMVNDATEEHCYDLQGRRMSLPAKKGVYIINGKKRIIK